VHCRRSRIPLPRYVCSPLHEVMNASVITLEVLLAGGVLLAIVAMTATVLMFSGYTRVTGFGGMERLAVYPLRCWPIIAGIWLLHEQTAGTATVCPPAGAVTSSGS
jgi:hypothetical protein